MKEYKKSHRRLAIFFLLIFIPTIIPTNAYGSNNGPLAPEAASFEPVDSSDMVNLASGDLAYVLPLINVPSPEGGYPLSLSYHAGIGLDQEGSWTGLGWNVNPGAINRTVNHSPDDWNEGRSVDFIYSDLGTHDVVTVGVGIQAKIFSAALDYTFVDGKGKGGVVSIAAGLEEFGVGASFSQGFGAYGDYTSAEATIGNLSVSGTSGKGLAVNVNVVSISTPYYSAGMKFGSQGISFSGGGMISATSGSASVGIGGYSAGFSNGTTTNARGVTTVQNSFNAGIPIGPAFSLRFRYSRARYSMFDTQTSIINGTLYSKTAYDLYDEDENINFRNKFMDAGAIDLKVYQNSPANKYTYITAQMPYLAYDTYAVSGQGLMQNIQPFLFDSKTVVLSGLNQPERTGVGPRELRYNDRYHIGSQYADSYNSPSAIPELNRIWFHGLNSNTSYMDNSLTEWDETGNLNQITDIGNLPLKQTAINKDGINYDSYNTSSNRLKKDSYIQSYTNEQISEHPNVIIQGNNFDRSEATLIAPKGIGAFRITTVDGKTYHYSIPVYNYEMFLRSYDQERGDDSKFFEKINSQPFATHWLLTAITGPDYIDNNSNGITDENDYGYWVNFEYGKYTNSYVWKKESFDDKNIKENPATTPGKFYCEKQVTPTNSRSVGIKQIYYLNSVNTRTHSALFIKSLRNDDKGNNYSKAITYDEVSAAVVADNQRATGIYISEAKYRYNVDLKGEFPTLKLDRIALIKREDKQYFNITPQQTPENQAANSIKIKSEVATYNILMQYLGTVTKPLVVREWTAGTFKNNLYMSNTINQTLLNSKALKQIRLDYDYSLGISPGKLTLKSVNTIGKNNATVLPPYKFEYYNLKSYDRANYDLWGFDKTVPHNYSLRNIITPLGSVLNIEYEKDDFSTSVSDRNIYGGYYSPSGLGGSDYAIRPVARKITRNGPGTQGSLEVDWHNPCYEIGQIYSCITVGNQVTVKLKKKAGPFTSAFNEFTTTATITAVSGKVVSANFSPALPGEYTSGDLSCSTDNEVGESSTPNYSVIMEFGNCSANDELIGKCNDSRGGIRVKAINTNEDGKTLSIKYSYNKPNSEISSGITGASPYVRSSYSQFFPGGVMYEYVTVAYSDGGGNIAEKQLYQFNVLTPNVTYTFNKDMYSINIPNPRAVPNEMYTSPNFYNSEGSASINFANLLKIDISEKVRHKNVLAESDSEARIVMSSASVKDNTSKIGNLLSVTKLNASGQELSKQTVNYAPSFVDDFGTYGEAFKSVKSHKVYTGSYAHYYEYSLNSSKFKVFPSKTLSSVSKENGFETKVSYDKHDFLSGQATEITRVAGNGKSVKTKIIPAYHKYPGMGSTVDNANNRNMLAQTAATYSYIFDDGQWKETGVGITTWNNIWEYRKDDGTIETIPANHLKEHIWRKHKTFIWNGTVDTNGILQNYHNANGDDDYFNWNVGAGSQPSQWKETLHQTLYDHFSAPLEVKDLNNNYSSTKMGNGASKILSGGNAKYTELFYTGGEYVSSTYINGMFLEPEVRLEAGDRFLNTATFKAHTGDYSIATTSSSTFGVKMRGNEHRPGRYKITVWAHTANASKARVKIGVGSSPVPFNGESYSAGAWTLKTHYFDVADQTAEVYPIVNSIDGTTVYYDDLMIRPIASSITGYVYNNWNELTHIIGNNGLATKYEYDNAGRLVRTYVEVVEGNGITNAQSGFKLKSSNGIKYKNL